MDVIVYVESPLSLVDVWSEQHLYDLVKAYWKCLETNPKSTHALTLLAYLCQTIVSNYCAFIIEDIELMISKWQRKAPQIYAHVSPERCFFGIKESEVLKNLNDILPWFFMHPLHGLGFLHWEKFLILNQVFAREVTQKVNLHIAEEMGSSIYPEGKLCDFKCYNTFLYTVAGLDSPVLRCKNHKNCQFKIPGSSPSSEEDIISSPLIIMQEGGKPQHLAVVDGGGDFIVNYYARNQEMMEILTGNAEYRSLYIPNINPKNPYANVWMTKDAGDKQTASAEDQAIRHHTHESSERTDSFQSAQQEHSFIADGTYDETKCTLVVVSLAKFLLHTTKKAQTSLPQEDLNSIIKNLKDKAMGEIKLADILINPNIKNVEKTAKALFRDMLEEFGSAQEVLEAMTSQNAAAADLVIQSMKTHLTVPTPLPQKNVISRFFSSVGKAIMKPFREAGY